MGVSVWYCVCCSHLISVPTPCLECVHALVHVFMPTWVLNYAALPMHNNMEHGCHSVADCVLQSSHFCTCISTWMYVHLTAHVGSSPFEQFHENMGGPVCLSQSAYFWTLTFVRMCTCISTLYLCPSDSLFHFYTPMQSNMERCVPLCITLWLFQ